MLTAKELKARLEEIPDDAKIFVYLGDLAEVRAEWTYVPPQTGNFVSRTLVASTIQMQAGEPI